MRPDSTPMGDKMEVPQEMEGMKELPLEMEGVMELPLERTGGAVGI